MSKITIEINHLEVSALRAIFERSEGEWQHQRQYLTGKDNRALRALHDRNHKRVSHLLQGMLGELSKVVYKNAGRVPCAKCGKPIPRKRAIRSKGEGEEEGKVFFYCSNDCEERH